MEQLAPETQNQNPEVNVRPIAELPETDMPPKPDSDDKYWSRRNMRSDEPYGPSFPNNLPVAEIGVYVEAVQATRSVATTQRLNEIVDQHNPGGMRFVDDEGFVSHPEFLAERIGRGEFPQSKSNSLSVPQLNPYLRYLHQEGLHNPGLEVRRAHNPFLEEADPVEFIGTTYEEHDVADHAGLIALDPKNVQQLMAIGQGFRASEFYGKVSENLLNSLARRPVAAIDYMLVLVSNYAITTEDSMPPEAHGPRPDGTPRPTFKEYLKEEILRMQAILNKATEGYSKVPPLEFDFETFDANVERMQAIRPKTTVAQRLGGLAIAA